MPADTAGRFSGKCALVIGGSRGIGRATVERLAHEGARVAFTYASNAEAARATEAAVASGAAGESRSFQIDFGQWQTIPDLYEGAASWLRGLDIVVHNAAVVRTERFEAATADAYDYVMTANVKGLYLSMREAARRLNDGGRIINVSSINTLLGSPGTALYSASKAAAEQFAAVAARELGARGITVNSVSPGATDTDMLRGSNTPEAIDAMAGTSPLGRIGLPEEVASVICFLASDDGGWITGQNILAGGGFR